MRTQQLLFPKLFLAANPMTPIARHTYAAHLPAASDLALCYGSQSPHAAIFLVLIP